jgi:hypothetical protein
MSAEQELEVQMEKKTDQELLDMVSDTHGWFPKTLDAARAELQRRNVALPQQPVRTQSGKSTTFRSQRTTQKKRIAHISIHQTSKVLAILYVVLGLLFIPIGVILIISGQMVMGIIYVLMPFIYGIVGYPLVAGMCWVYNMIAKSVGGIEFTIENEDHAA